MIPSLVIILRYPSLPSFSYLSIIHFDYYHVYCLFLSTPVLSQSLGPLHQATAQHMRNCVFPSFFQFDYYPVFNIVCSCPSLLMAASFLWFLCTRPLHNSCEIVFPSLYAHVVDERHVYQLIYIARFAVRHCVRNVLGKLRVL